MTQYARILTIAIALVLAAIPAASHASAGEDYDLDGAAELAMNGLDDFRAEFDDPPLPRDADLAQVTQVWVERAANGEDDPVDVDEVPNAESAWGSVHRKIVSRQPSSVDDGAYGLGYNADVPRGAPGLDGQGAAVAVRDFNEHQVEIFVAHVVRISHDGAPDPEPEPSEPQQQPPLRVYEANPTAAAVALARATWPSRESAGHAVLSRDDVFADSLAGSPLAADGPILFTNGDTLDPVTRAFLEEWFAAGSTVYLLGGEAALSSTVEQAVVDLGLVPVRLAGPGRIETALAVAEHVVDLYGTPDRVAITRADDWADSIAVAAYAAETRMPVVLTGTDDAPEAVVDFVAASGARPVVLGGAAAVSDATAAQFGAHDRVAGATRDETALAVANDLWGLDSGGVAELFVIDGDMPNGWAWGLAAAARQASRDAALVMIRGEHVPSSTAGTAEYCIRVTILGDYTVIPEVMDSMFTQAC